MAINPLASVDSKAQVADDVEVGPYVVIGPDVVIGEGTVIHQSATIVGHTTIGKGNVIFPYCCLGTPPQDLAYVNEATRLVIGDDNVFRESVTVHRASTKENGITTIGSHNYFMAVSHVAHDCIVEDHAVFGNCVLIGGHVKIGVHAILNGGSGVHPFSTIGQYAYVGGLTRIVQDAPPFMIMEGHPSRVRGVNVVGMRRGGFPDDAVEAVEKAHRRIYRRGRVRAQALDEFNDSPTDTQEVQLLVAFLRDKAKSPIGRYHETIYRAEH